MQASSKMHHSLQEARYYHASHLQDVSYSAGGKILSCKLLPRLQEYVLLVMQESCKRAVYLTKS